MLFKPDKTFYPSAALAMQGPKENLGYVAVLAPNGKNQPDAIACIDLDPKSASYGQVKGRVNMPYVGDELHHFGWNACSSALCPNAPHPHVERRYLIVPGIRSSRLYVLDIKKDPINPKIIKIIEPEEVYKKSGYSRLHTVHCGAAGIFVSALGNPDGDGPGGILLLDHLNFEVIGKWELDRGPQYMHYDFWWNLGYDVLFSSEWGTPNMIENGLNLELLLNSQYGHQFHVWDLSKRRHIQMLDLGKEHQIVLEIRPAHNPTKPYGFVGVVTSLKDLSSSVWLYQLKDGKWEIKKVIEIPAQPADPDVLPPALKDFKAVPPLVTDINLSLDDKMLYVSCWGTGDLHQYDVSIPEQPKLIGTISIGGIVKHTSHPKNKDRPLNGGPQMIECSRDGKRVYVTNSLYSSWDQQFYPEGIRGWMIKVDTSETGMSIDPEFFIDFGEERPHQLRLAGGDSSSDSYCFA